MSSDFEIYLDKYAEVIVKVGLNIQPGQRLLIGMPFYYYLGTPIELAPLVRLVTKHAYQAGARLVEVMWHDEGMELIRHQHAPSDSFENFPSWRTDGSLEIAKAGDGILVFASGTPDKLKDQKTDQIDTFFKSTITHMKPIIDLRVANALPFVVTIGPIEGWADKVFSHIPSESRMAKAWDTIFEISRIKESDPVSAWEDHINQLMARKEYLNKKQYSALKLTGPGTDLLLGLPKNHNWVAAQMTSQNGITYTANIPTEEIFTAPHKDKTEGTVTTTKPLVVAGGVIENIVLTFSEGKVVKASAGKNQALLDKQLVTDEGMLRLGEIALVPHSSPISQAGLLFYSVLIDENASNHIALGRAYKFNLQDSENLSDNEFSAAGGNISMDHMDMMIGSGEMDIDGLLDDGSKEPIMRAGEWAFDV